MSSKTLTPEQLKAKFVREGRTFSEWARQNGFPPVEVYKVVNGLSKGRWGRGHDIAVKLGLKAA
jgi:gp16 family phage-associated protein